MKAEYCPGRGNLGDRLAADHLLVARARHVDDRRFAADGDRLRHASDLQVRVHGGDEPAGQLDAFALDRGESRQRERDRIGARPQIFNRILTDAVGHDRARLLDERRTRRFNRDAGQHGARRVPDRADDRGLRKCRGGHQRQ